MAYSVSRAEWVRKIVRASSISVETRDSALDPSRSRDRTMHLARPLVPRRLANARRVTRKSFELRPDSGALSMATNHN